MLVARTCHLAQDCAILSEMCGRDASHAADGDAAGRNHLHGSRRRGLLMPHFKRARSVIFVARIGIFVHLHRVQKSMASFTNNVETSDVELAC